jgi:hypothetical protein
MRSLSHATRHAAIVPAVFVLLLWSGQQRAAAQGCSSIDFKVAPTFEGTVYAFQSDWWCGIGKQAD